MDFQLSPSQPTKLTSWKNEPTIQILKDDLQMAKPSHDDQVRRIDHWNDLMKVTGSAKPPKVAGRSSVQPKLIRRQAEWRYSALTEPFLGSDKLFKIEPVTFEDTDAAAQNQLLLNWQFRTKINKVKFIDDFVRCTVDEGSCVLRAGWQRSSVTITEQVPVFDHYEITTQEEVEAFQQALQARQDNPRGFNETADPALKAALEYYDETKQATLAKQTGTNPEQVEKVLENYPTVDVLNPKNVYIDPSCLGVIDKALFVIVTFETSQAELKKEPKRYKNLDRVNWETATPVTENEHDTGKADYGSNNFKDVLRKRVVAYEYWGFYDIDGTGRLKPIVCTWIGDTLIRMEENPFPDGKLPFVVATYLPIKRELFGEPDAELLEDNQKILGAVTRGMIDLMGRSANGQQGFAKGMLDPLNRRRYEKGQDYEFNPNLSPTAGLIEHKYPEIPASAMNMVQLQNQEAEALTGVKSFGGGLSGNAYGDVAAGIRGALDAASKREMAILRRLAKAITELGNKFIAMNAVFLSKPEVIRVTNTEFVKVSREDIKGNFDLIVDISTAEVDDQKSKDLGFMLQTMGPNMDSGITMMVLSEIATLKRMPDLAKKLKDYKPQPTPEQQKLQELAIEKAQLENDELRSKIELNNAKAAAEAAKKDKADLDYVEQESGTTHERALEKDRAQSEGNQNLEVTKALLKPQKPEEKKPDIDAAVGFNQLSDRLNKSSPSEELERGAPAVDNTLERDALRTGGDPRYNLSSRFYDPSADPTANPNLNI